MKAGRNDPCPCGSGRKYKKCCLAQDKTNRQEQLEVRSRELVAPRVDGEPAPLPAPFIPTPRAQTRRQAPPNPRIKAINARWEEFKEQDVDGQIELFLATVEDADLMDDELAFSMLETFYRECIRRDERDRFDGLVEILRARLPDVYAKSKKCYLRCKRRSMFDDTMSPHRSRGHAPPPPKHALCPDRATLDTFLAQRLDFMAPQYHRVAATLELVPAWLRFLERCTLIEKSLPAKTLAWTNSKNSMAISANSGANWTNTRP